MQLYEEKEPVVRGEAIDIFDILDTMWKNLRKYYLRLLVLFTVLAAAFIGYTLYTYVPDYESYVTFVVTKDNNSTSDALVTKRIAKSFPYLLQNGGLASRIKKEMGISGKTPLPVSITAAAMEDTNFLTVTAVSHVDTQAQQAAEAVIKNMEQYTVQVVGNVSLTLIDQTGFPDAPRNPLNQPLVVLKGCAVGILAVLAILFLLAYSDSTVRRYEDLKKYINVPCLGTVPMTRFKKRRQAFDSRIIIKNNKIPSSFRESINTLRTRVEKEMRDHRLKTLLISSSIPGEGKTTIALNLALALAERDKRVLLIDGDLRNPSLHTLLGVEQKSITYGITDVLMGKVTAVEACVEEKALHLDLILGRKEVGNASELLSSRRMQRLIEEMSDYYDYIIVDTPPAAMMADASVVAAYMDAVLYVIRQDYAEVKYMTEGIALLSDSDTRVIGCVLNCAEAGIGGYGYGKYGYGKYGYGYGKYHSETE